MMAVPVPFCIDHTPPAVASVKAGVVEFTHTAVAPPPIAATVVAGLIVNTADAVTVVQPVTVYCTITVPAVCPVTTPPCVMMAVPVPFCIDQTPPAVASVNAGVVELIQTELAPPPIAAAVTAGLIVSAATASEDPQPVTV